MSTDNQLQPTQHDIARFWAKVNQSDGGDACWPWLAHTSRGYGLFQIGKRRAIFRTVSTHRMAYELLVGPIPDGLQLDHLCRNRSCCNPTHLEPVTPGENTRRGLASIKRKTHCPAGHEYASLGYRRSDKGGFTCRVCHRVANREYARRRRAAA